MRIAILVAVAMLGGCFPEPEDAQDAQAKLELKRDELNAIGGEARGLYAGTALLCAQKQAQNIPALKSVCSRHEQAFAVFDRGYQLAAKTLNAAQIGLMTYEQAAGAVDALDAVLDKVHGLMAEATDAVASGGGEWISPSDRGADEAPGGAAAPEADADKDRVAAQPEGTP